MAAKLSSWIHSFTVTDSQTHKKGYSIYKITSIVFPLSVPETLTCVTVWKRFNEVKKLYRIICKRHKDLHLGGTVPDLKDTDIYFNRFNPEIIQNRKAFILKLLDFTAQHPDLYKCHAFIHFFESGHSPNISPIRQQSSYTGNEIEPDQLYNDFPYSSDFTKENVKDSDEISLPSVSSSTTATTTPPQMGSQTSSVLSDAYSLGTDSPEVFSQNDDNISVENAEECTVAITQDIDVVDSSVDYMYQAALEFSEAVRAEVNLDYRLSFERYKQGIEILIKGARTDVQGARKQIAKDKTQKYLLRAEQIYEKYLLNRTEEETTINLLLNAQSNGTSTAAATHKYSIEMSINQLSKFKVLRILNKVMQVQDVTNKKIYIMKAIEKPSSNNAPQTLFLPQSISFMVPLVGYFQSDTTIYLLLQQASGGRLWDYLRMYEIKILRKQTSSLASLFTEPKDQVKSLEVQAPSSFIETLNLYKQNSVRPTRLRKSSSLTAEIEQLELNSDIPSFDVLTSSMDTTELLNCSQKLLKSVTNTLQSLSTTNETDAEEQCVVSGKNDGFSSAITVKNTINIPNNKSEPIQASPRKIRVNGTHHIPERSIKRWASEIVTALLKLHSQGIYCWDLNLDNILLGAEGQVQLSYFHRQDQKNLNIRAVVELYVAPERPLCEKSDWWSFGIILFELLTGQQFVLCHPGGISSYYEIQYPEDVHLSDDAKDLLQELIEVNLQQRYDGSQICKHAFFKDVKWQDIVDNTNSINDNSLSCISRTNNGTNLIYCD